MVSTEVSTDYVTSLEERIASWNGQINKVRAINKMVKENLEEILKMDGDIPQEMVEAILSQIDLLTLDN